MIGSVGTGSVVPEGWFEEVAMAIVGGLDLHRKQITFDVVDTRSGTVGRGRLTPADRESFRRWLACFDGEAVDLAVEGCTGWRFIVEECQVAGARAHLAEPADVAGLKGRRQHAKTDRLDARHLRELLEAGKLPECWIPPGHVLEIRAKVRLRGYAQMEQRRVDPFLPAGALLQQVLLVEPNPGAISSTCPGGIQHSGSLPASSSSRRCRASSRSVLACCRLPFRPATSAGSARCARTPATWHSSTMNCQPVQPSTARSTASPSKQASHRRNDSDRPA